ncbi:pentatricopeptide repeat-containing protein At2g37230-like [Olea europaea var. sylvestris]|uniref:pentatricopeptide repeat-containing protein At2g37230-like n=1 Tax=Olea europaea var. sylvestris TaxID=158386 RepID=UPI000C1D48FC|nr:pentatricopeptide repeat-containing protein At2g37230-like [Olea europaea var. sylvestris]
MKLQQEPIASAINRMMANRAWTTRLQNSIRNLVPSFDQELVYNVLHGSKSSEHALQFFRWVERSGLFQHTKETHLKIIEILGRASKLNHARCILLDMPKKGVEWDEDLWVLLIEGYGKGGIVQESVKLFQKMDELGVERTIKSYDTLFKVIMRKGRYMMAKRYFNKMLGEGIEPTTHTFNIMIWGFFLSGKVETANRYFEDMKSKDILPDVVTYNTLINGYYRVKKMDEAEKFFVEMKGRNIEPTVITYTTMIKGYMSVERVDDALKLLKEMKSFGIKPNAITYSTLLSGLCDAGKMFEARGILKEMVEKYIEPKDNAIFTRLISGQCKAGVLDAAMDVLKAMIRLSVPTEAGHYGILIENFCKAGQYDHAVKLLDKLIEKEIILRPQSTLHMEPSAYNPIIEYLCNNGQTEKAEILLRQLMKMGVQDPVALNNLLCGHAKEGNPEPAFEILNIMIRRNVLSEWSHNTLGTGRDGTMRALKIGRCNGSFLLYDPASKGRLECVLLFLDYGADPNRRVMIPSTSTQYRAKKNLHLMEISYNISLTFYLELKSEDIDLSSFPLCVDVITQRLPSMEEIIVDVYNSISVVERTTNEGGSDIISVVNMDGISKDKVFRNKTLVKLCLDSSSPKPSRLIAHYHLEHCLNFHRLHSVHHSKKSITIPADGKLILQLTPVTMKPNLLWPPNQQKMQPTCISIQFLP